MRSRLVLLAVVMVALATLVPVAAQTTTDCSVGFVHGVLRMTGACGALPHHLQPPPTFTGTIDPTPDRNLNQRRNGNRRDKRQRNQDQKNVRRDREDTKRVSASGTSTAIAKATSTAAALSERQTATAEARLTATARAQLTATAKAREDPRDDTDSGQANATNAQVGQSASDPERLDGALAPTPTADEARRLQRAQGRDRHDRHDRAHGRRDTAGNRKERADAVRAQEAPAVDVSGIFYPTPVPQLSPEPPFVNG